METAKRVAYLDRIGAVAPARPDLAGLRDLQLSHLRSVPFENLSIHLGEEIVLEPAALVAKVVDRRRGGFCYELNGALATLLTALGYQVSLLAAQVYNGPEPGPPFDHLALRVQLDGQPWLVDVGFGAFAHHPFRLDLTDPQPDPMGSVQVTPTAHGDLDITLDGDPQYRLETRPRRLADFVPTCWWHRTSPRSPFTQKVTCSRLTEDGRVTLTNRRLIRTRDGQRHEAHLASEPEVLAGYREEFGISLTTAPPVP